MAATVVPVHVEQERALMFGCNTGSQHEVGVIPTQCPFKYARVACTGTTTHFLV